MELNKGERDSTAMLHADYWTIGRWFSFLIIFTAAWAGIYLATHSENGLPGYEYASFNTEQVRQINRILTSNAASMRVAQDAQQPATFIDSSVSLTPSQNELNNLNTIGGCDINCRADKVLLYVNSEFDGKISPEQQQSLKQYISTFAQQDVGIFLSDYKLKVRSYFWLAGPLIYAEVVFWVVIGVVCSLLFGAGNTLRRSNKRAFDNKQVMYQVAKLFYAPFLTIVILLAYNYINHNTTLSTNLGQGIIVFGFIAGFFSGRFMNFMDRLKHLILPSSDNQDVHYAAPVGTQQIPVTANVGQINAVERMAVDENGELLTPEVEIAPRKKNDDEIDVEIEVKLDTSGLFDEEKENIIAKGFTKAIVTLHNVNGKEIVPAKKTGGDDANMFTAYNVKPGIYIARATLSQKLQDDRIINFFGERTTYVTADKPGLELYIRKYELAD